MCIPCASLGSSPGAVVLSGEGICCSGRLCPVSCGLSREAGAGFSTQRIPEDLSLCAKEAAKAGGAATRHTLCLIRSQTMQPKRFPWDGMEEPECLDKDWTGSPCVGKSSTKAAGRKTSKSSTRCLKEVSRGVTDGARWSGDNVGQENSCLFSYVSNGQQETSWGPYLGLPTTGSLKNLSQRPRVQEGVK